MGIQDILDKISEAGVSLWEMKEYNFTLLDKNGKQWIVKDIRIDSDNKKIILKLG